MNHRLQKVIRQTKIKIRYGNSEHFEFSRYSHEKNFHENDLDCFFGEINIHVEAFLPSLIPFIADIFLNQKISKISISFNESVRSILTFEIDKIFTHRAQLTINSDLIIINRITLSTLEQGITFGIVSGGNNDSKIKSSVESILSNYKENFEIIIAGPKCSAVDSKHIKYVNVVQSSEETRIPICHKKNLIVESASHETVILMHDRYVFPDGFSTQLSQDTFSWDILCLKQRSMNLQGYRLQDWLEIDEVDISKFTSNKDINHMYPFSLARRGTRLSDYANYPKKITINGGVFAVKKSWFQNVKLAEYLYWAEIEDDDFSLRAQNAGALIRLSHATVISMDERSSGIRDTHAFLRLKFQLKSSLWLGVHSAIKYITRNISEKLNPNSGFTKKKIIYSKEKSLVLDARQHFDIINIESFDTLYIFGMEHIEDPRSVLKKIRAISVPNQKLVFEYCTFGVGFFSRLRSVRNCELFCYEISLTFRNDIILERMVNTSQNNFLLEYRNKRKKENNYTERNLLVVTSAQQPHSLVKENANLDVFVTKDGCITKENICNYQAILLVLDETSNIDKLPFIPDEFEVYKLSPEKSALIKSNLLIAKDVFLDCMPVNTVRSLETFKKIFVHNIAIKGYSITLSCP